MTRTIPSQARAALLAQLENLVGNSCYNGNIQNWGPGGVFLGEGRSFRYPLTLIDSEGDKVKRHRAATDVPPETLKTGYYAFGANQLHIVEALDEVLKYLESNHGLKL